MAGEPGLVLLVVRELLAGRRRRGQRRRRLGKAGHTEDLRRPGCDPWQALQGTRRPFGDHDPGGLRACEYDLTATCRPRSHAVDLADRTLEDPVAGSLA